MLQYWRTNEMEKRRDRYHRLVTSSKILGSGNKSKAMKTFSIALTSNNLVIIVYYHLIQRADISFSSLHMLLVILRLEYSYFTF